MFHTIGIGEEYGNAVECWGQSANAVSHTWCTTNGSALRITYMYCMWCKQAVMEWSKYSDLGIDDHGKWPLMLLVNLVKSWLYSRICLIRHLKGLEKSGESGELMNYANRWKLHHRSSYTLS